MCCYSASPVSIVQFCAVASAPQAKKKKKKKEREKERERDIEIDTNVGGTDTSETVIPFASPAPIAIMHVGA